MKEDYKEKIRTEELKKSTNEKSPLSPLIEVREP